MRSSRWHAARGLYDRAAAVTSAFGPGFTLSAAGVAGHVSHWAFRRSPSVSDLLELFGGRDTAASRAPLTVAREISALRFKNRALISLVGRHGLVPLARRVRRSPDDALVCFREPARPTVLISWHLGVLFGAAAVLIRERIPALMIRQSPFYDPVPPVELAFTTHVPEARAATMWRAMTRLRERGVVLMAADGTDASTTAEVTCLGRAVRFARGPFTLARMTGADLVPLVPRWDSDGRIVADVGKPLLFDRGAGINEITVETAAARAAAVWLESYLLAAPAQLWVDTLQRFRQAPRLVEIS